MWEGNSKSFIWHKTQASLPLLSKNGHLLPAKSKSINIKYIEEGCEIPKLECQFDPKQFHGVALVKMLQHVNCRTFNTWCKKRLI